MRSIIFPLKANHGRERDPVCVLAVNIAAVDQINVEVVDWTPGQPELEARIGYANGILPSAELAEVFGQLGVRQDAVGVTEPRFQVGLRWRPIDDFNVDLIYGRNVYGENSNWITLATVVRFHVGK